jgi:hypothetical protein
MSGFPCSCPLVLDAEALKLDASKIAEIDIRPTERATLIRDEAPPELFGFFLILLVRLSSWG